MVDWIDGISSLEDHTKIPRFKLKPLPKLKIKRRPEPIDKDFDHGYTTFITSSVLGTKGRHAVLLSLPKGSQEQAIAVLRQAQAEYGLTDIYLFELSNAFLAICLKAVQRNRYQKILDMARSPSAGQLRNYDRVSLRMGPLVDGEMRTLEPPARFVTYLECRPEIRDSNFVSRGHIAFLRRNGLTPIEYAEVHGSEEFKLVDAEMRL